MSSKRLTAESPPLARYMGIDVYGPQVGDFLIWSGWFRTWYGVVASVDVDNDVVDVIFEGLPILLFTLRPEEQRRETKQIRISDIIGGRRPGTWSAMQHDAKHNTPIWFI